MMVAWWVPARKTEVNGRCLLKINEGERRRKKSGNKNNKLFFKKEGSAISFFNTKLFFLFR